MGNVPKSLKDFKKASSNSAQNTLLTPSKVKQAQQNLSLDEVMATQQPVVNGQMMNGQQTMPQANNDFATQGEFPSSLKPNFDNAFKQANSMENKVDTPMPTMGFAPMQETPIQNDVPPMMDANIPSPQAVVPQQVMQSQTVPQQTFPQQVVVQVAPQPAPIEKKDYGVPQNMREDFVAQPYKTVQTPITSNSEKKQNKSFVSHMQEIEQEIDCLVNNTEAFLNNTKALKIQILQAKDKKELNEIMLEVHNTLREIPSSFIDAETRRRIRVCFSYLQKTKIELLEAEEKIRETEKNLQNLAAIDDVETLEQEMFNVTASPTVDNVFEVRTFEINLINQLPVIKEEMLREKMRNI